MKTLSLAVFALAVSAHASSILWTWTPPSSGASSYNLYQASGNCPATGIPIGAMKIATGTTLTSFTQSTVPTGVTCTYVTAVSAVGVEGPPSATFQFDATAPTAPGSLKGTYQP